VPVATSPPLSLRRVPLREVSPEWEPRVLVVDDDVISRLAAAELLRSLGFVVDVAGGGPEALILSEGWPYVAIFMDCEMPDIDGYTAARRLRHRGAASSHPLVIAVTSHSRSVSMASGMDHHLTKPLQIDVLRTECMRLDLLPPESLSAESARHLCIDTPLLDPHTFVQSIGSDRDVNARAAVNFLESATLRLPELWRAINAGDAQAIEKLAVTLGRQAGLVGAARAGALCDRLREAAVSAGDTGSVERLLRAVLRDTAGAITAYVDAVVLLDESVISIPDSVGAGLDVRDVASPQASVRVAFADDDPIARITIKAMLRRAHWIELIGYAAGVEEAVELAAVKRPDVFVVDWIMPGGGGAETVRRILRHRPDTLVIALTASDNLETLVEVTAAGAACLVAKGGSGEQLIQTIGRALKAPAAARAAAKDTGSRRRGLRVGVNRAAPAGQNGAPAQRSGLNWISVERLHTDFDATGIIFELVELFGSETPKRVSDLRTAINAGDSQAVSRHAHQLKGGCMTLAAEYAAELCNELEVAAGDGSPEGAMVLTCRIDAALQDAYASLRREFPPPEVPRTEVPDRAAADS
jgi:CheY-like chemotaxis protein